MGFVVKPLQSILGCLTLFLSAAVLQLALAPQPFSKFGADSSLRSLSALRVSALCFFHAPSITPPSAQASSDHSHTYLGFDRNIYPGDSSLPILRKSFAFTSYWISPPPGEKLNTWKGKRELLLSHGFGFLVLYRGPDSSELKDETYAMEKGTQDSRAAAASAKKEGFAAGTIMFLDIEEGGRLPATYHAYLRAWSEELKRAGFLAGVYCSSMPVVEEPGVTITTAEDIRNQAKSHEIAIWAYNDACPPAPGCAFPENPPAPSASGIAFAAVWQFAQSPRRKEFTARCPAKYATDGNCYAPNDTAHKWFLDVNTATSPDPSHGAN
jgi:glycoside hydrolase-like protein